MNKFIIKHLTIISLLAFFLVGCQSPQNNRAIDVSSKSMAADVKLGTQWGDGIESHVQGVNLYRINTNPLDTITIYYSAQTQNSGKPISEVMLNNGRVGMSILYDNDNKWPLIKQKNIINLQGKVGETYRLFYRNYSKDTYEIVATIDGLDVINGKAGSLSNNGYILRPNDTLIIEGFRKNNSEVAAFTFSNSNNAYSNYTDEGSPKNIGVIGTAIFQLNSDDAQHSENTPNAFPADKTDNSYAKPPRY